MTLPLFPTAAVSLLGAPDGHDQHGNSSAPPMQLMHLEITQDIVDDLLAGLHSGKSPQILFGRTPQLKYGDKTHLLHASPERHRHELYKPTGAGHPTDLEFAGLLNHGLVVQKANDVTAGVDSALEQLRSSMAAISEFKEANKTIVGDATPRRAPGHGRFPSTSFKPSHLAPAKLASPLLTAPSSPRVQPGNPRESVLDALRVPVIHLLARQPSTATALATSCCTSVAYITSLLPKIAKKSSPDADKWQLTDKSYREVNPWKFPYQSTEDRQQAIDGAIKSFDRQRLAKDDKLWQILLPRDERGQGICLSRSTVKAPEVKAKSSTPMHKISDLTKKKPVVKKAVDKGADKEKKTKMVKDVDAKPKSTMKEKYLARDKPTVKVKGKDVVKDARDKPTQATVPTHSKDARDKLTQATVPTHSRPAPPPTAQHPAFADAPKIRTKRVSVSQENSASWAKSRPSAKEGHPDPPKRQFKSTMPVNTKPKNPSPLSASPPVNASDFEDNHPVHKALAAAPKKTLVNSDRTLKRKANDLDSDMHNHALAIKKPHIDRSTPTHNPSHTNGRLTDSTSSSTSSRKSKSEESSSSMTPITAPKIRKVTNIDTGLASRYHHNNPRASPGASSSSTTSPSLPSLSFRQTVELSQQFQRYYKRYEEMYWKLADAMTPPTDAQRNSLLEMHKKLEEMKREIKAGATHHR